MTPSWDILIPSICHRTEQLDALLDELGRQRLPGMGAIVYRDNRDEVYGPKCQRLYEASEADYVSMLDDDDWVSHDYVEAVMAALQEGPDYVGYKILYTEHGVPQRPVVHSLKAGGWHDSEGILWRDICHKNPMRRDLALRGQWMFDGGADIHWADQIRSLGIVRSEVFIDRELYHYRSTGAYNTSDLAPMPDPPPRPDHGWVTWI